MEDYTKFLEEKFQSEVEHTPLGEPQIWLSLESGRSVEITFESNGFSRKR